MTPPQNSDTSVSNLLAAVRAGSPEAAHAADALFRRFEPWLKVLARAHVESRFVAKFDPSDVVQQTLLEAVRALPQFRGTTAPEFSAWLRQILTHVLAHEIRRHQGTRKRDLRREVSLDQELTAVSERLGDLIPVDATSPTEAADRRDREVQLARVLDRLPADHRTVLVLRHLEGLTHEEIAHRMNRNPGAVRMLWVRALARLRQELNGRPL